jgi:hypothetical protein
MNTSLPMLPQPLNLSPSPLLVFQEKQHSSSLFGFGMLPPSPYGGMIVPPPVDSPSSISTKKTNHKKSVPPARKAKKSVRWGSAFSHTSKLRNPEDVSLMWYNVSSYSAPCWGHLFYNLVNMPIEHAHACMLIYLVIYLCPLTSLSLTHFSVF